MSGFDKVSKNIQKYDENKNEFVSIDGEMSTFTALKNILTHRSKWEREDTHTAHQATL